MTPLLHTSGLALGLSADVAASSAGAVAPAVSAAVAGGSLVVRSAESYSDAELVGGIAEIEQAIRAARMEQLRLIAEAERRRLFVEQGARSMSVWLQGLLNVDSHDAKTRIRVAGDVQEADSEGGAQLPDLPATAAALAEGSIGLEHAKVISKCKQNLLESSRDHDLAKVEAILADHATRMCPRDLAKLADRIRYLLDQDGARRDEEAQHEARELHYATARDGMLVIKARLDRETGAKFVEAIRPLSAPRPETDGEKDPRTAGQRNADGFAAMVDIVLDSDQMPRTGGQRPHLNVTIDFDDLKRTLLKAADEGMPGTLGATEQSITAENIRRIACDCEVLPTALGGDSLPLDVGMSQRTAPTHIRAALLHRDGACAFPGCDRPPGTPQAHHIVHWADGGPTEINNMVMTCAHHHRVIHNQHWKIEMQDSRPVFIPPTSVDRSRTPRPGGKALPAAYRDNLRDLIPKPRDPEGAP
ncbi:HNH endonuclease [Saccharopolyspora shandongensis]|uniref:HNH endonuclease n=1 Tax=Saccharopolyspora shandongensis TaxID=418495 RepID=A0A1H2R1H0_9PSEU|nr:HNH endonuclease [Saccharopolyspora shandongensis]